MTFNQFFSLSLAGVLFGISTRFSEKVCLGENYCYIMDHYPAD